MYLPKYGYSVSAFAIARNTLIKGSNARASLIGCEAVSGSISLRLRVFECVDIVFSLLIGGVALLVVNAPTGNCSSEWSPQALVNTPFIHQLEELVIVAIVYVYPDEYGTRSVEGLLKHSLDLVRRLNHETMGSERLRILYGINRAERRARGAAVLLFFLDGDHVVGAIDPDHVNKVRLETNGSLKLHTRKQETTVAGDRQDLFGWANERGCNSPRKCDSECLLTVGDEHLSRAEAIEVSCHPKMEGAHVQAKRGIRCEKVL